GQVVAQVLAQRALVGAVVEHVVGDLEGDPEVQPVVVQACLGGRIGPGQQCAQAGGGGEQDGGLALDHAQVGRLVHVRVAHVQQLQDLAFGDPVGGVGEDPLHLHGIQLHH